MAFRTSALTTIGALALSALAVSPASALVISISSSSTVLDIALTVAGLPLTVGPAVPAAGSAPPGYDVTNSGSFSLPNIGLSTGLLTDTASSPFPPTETGTATSTAESFSFAPAGGLLFDLTATTIASTSSVDGTSPATGSTALTGLILKIAGHTFTFSGTPAPNDVLFTLPGLTVTLNQQIPDKTETEGITTNAIAIDFADFHVGLNAVNGAVDIGQSAASLTVIPEPATWVEMLAGFGAVGLLLVRGRPRSRAAAGI
jgi:hypothetical protein